MDALKLMIITDCRDGQEDGRGPFRHGERGSAEKEFKKREERKKSKRVKVN